MPVVNLEDGSILRGERAPLRKDLDRWLDEHPGYMVDRPDDDEVGHPLPGFGTIHIDQLLRILELTSY